MITMPSANWVRLLFRAVGSLDGLTLEWDRNDFAARNLFRDRLPWMYLKRGAVRGHGDLSTILFDRREETWSEFAQDRLEPQLGNASSLSTAEDPLVLFRIWTLATHLDPDNGFPRVGEVKLEYVPRILSRPPFAGSGSGRSEKG